MQKCMKNASKMIEDVIYNAFYNRILVESQEEREAEVPAFDRASSLLEAPFQEHFFPKRSQNVLKTSSFSFIFLVFSNEKR